MGMESYGMLEGRRKALLRKMSKVGPFMMATATDLRVKCGNPKCKCKKDRQARHQAMHLSWTDAAGNGTQYVPVGLREEVLEWIENYWIIKEYLKEMTSLSRRMIRLYVKSQKKTKKRRKI